VTPLPFRPTEPLPPTLLQRLRGRRPPRNALIELVNQLAESPSVEEITPDRIDGIERKHRVNLRESFRSELEGLYRDFLLHCLEDRHLSEEELAAACHLADVFGLVPARRDLIQRQVVRSIYLGSVEDVLADGTVDAQERVFLGWLRERLGIPEDAANNMLEMRERRVRERGRGAV
jgi:hypothetical protein